jgi:hypothetical protein
MKRLSTRSILVLATGLLTFLVVLAIVHYRGRDRQEAPSSLAHVRNTFELMVHAPYLEAARLFGPEGERGWGQGHWNPHFLYPQPAQDIEGAVFTVKHGSHDSVWVNTAMSTSDHHFQYVCFLPGILVTTVDVRFRPIDSAHTHVTVTYDRTALTVEANENVRRLGQQDSRSGPDWESAVNAYLIHNHH